MRITIVAVQVAVCLASAALAWGEPAQQILITPDQLTWSAGPPTVPPGTSRLRVVATAAHSEEELSRASACLAAAFAAAAPVAAAPR